MENNKKTMKSSNDGYSLVELIVTVLISSIIMIAVVGFLTTGLNHYRNVNAESVLQIESQAAELFVTELFQESTDFRVIDSTKYSGEIKYAVEVSREAKKFILAQKGDELWFSEVTGTDDVQNLTELLNKGRAKTFLAKCINTFKIGDGNENNSFAETVTSSNGLMKLNLEFKMDKKEYSSRSMISLRNIKKN